MPKSAIPLLLAPVLLATASLLSPAAHAAGVDDAVATFIGEDGFEAQDVATVDERLLAAFTASPAGAARPDGEASPLEKALLLVETLEPALPRTRTMLRYGQMLDGDTPYAFVTVERYNFGPAIRQMVIEDYGEENTDEPEAFGVGPHVAWRIVTMPLMGQQAALVSVARGEITDKDAEATECGGRGCLAFEPFPDDLHQWQETETTIDIASPYAEKTQGDVAAPARIAAELAIAAGIAGSHDGRMSWHGPEQPEAARHAEPFLFLSIDRDLGQETAMDAMLGQTLLNDDAVEELWQRRVEFPGMVAFMQAATPRSR
ncbi:MAG: hypothetical protein M9945_00150 [Aquamicrobium sp.]|uniref:hypothetical protein n=1 Tax=Aquamicrobium sp. TaxID=1872579 RepID=UPI00349E6087|nr:hypothetical protein [Aquamicrobium sp.]